MCETAHAHPAGRTSPLQWLIVVLLTVIATCLLIEVGRSQAVAYPAEVGQKNGVFAVSAQLTRDIHGLYLVDTDNGTICVYEYVPSKDSGQKLRLKAARTYTFDTRLDEYNTEPLPREIKTLVESTARLNSTASQPN